MEGKIDTRYKRVVPRDLFNEAKLLKCLGVLSLMVLDGKIEGLRAYHDGKPFTIGQHSAGYLTTTEGVCFRRWDSEETLWLGQDVNSRSNYPLFCYDENECDEIRVFDEEGNVTEEFNIFLGNKTEG